MYKIYNCAMKKEQRKTCQSFVQWSFGGNEKQSITFDLLMGMLSREWGLCERKTMQLIQADLVIDVPNV